MIVDALKAALADHAVRELPQKKVRAAAVLVPLRLRNGKLQLILTRRTEHLAHHAGEISFPGGGVDPQDTDDWATALRETQEEVGVAPDQVEYIGRLDDCYSIHNYRVSCHVGLLPADIEFTKTFTDPTKEANATNEALRCLLKAAPSGEDRAQWIADQLAKLEN